MVQKEEKSMRILFASDSFKGTISSEESITMLSEAAEKIFPGCETIGVPVADGGEGTVKAVVEAAKGTYRQRKVCGPLMEEIQAFYGVIREEAAVIEMAAASGLPLVPVNLRNPLNTSTYGTGQLIQDALDQGLKKLSIAIGGSATNDGGMGAMRALGIRFLDKNGRELPGMGRDLEKVADIDMSGLNPAVKKAEITVMCDVRNPLTGPDGAAYTFGRQKGGTPEILDRLEAGMKNYASVMKTKLGIDVEKTAGAGAAGGLGAALCGFLNADLRPGIETVLDLIDFDRLLEGTDLVITGEGCMDGQSVFGKAPSGIGQRCKARGIPAVAIVGAMDKGAEGIYNFGIESILTAVNKPMDIDQACARARELYIGAAERTFRMIRVGMRMAQPGAGNLPN